MPELGPYGSMRGEARKSLPYRDFDAFRKANKIRAFHVSGLSCKLAARTEARTSPR